MADNKWHYLGRWIEPVLSTGLWLEWKELTKGLGLNFKGDIAVLDAYQYILQEDVATASQFLNDKIEADSEWFNRFFNLCEMKIQAVLSYKGKEDLTGLLTAACNSLGLITILIMFDIGYQKYVKKVAEKNNFNEEEFFSWIKPHRNTLLMDYIQELKQLDKTNTKAKDDFIKKYGWVGKHVFLGDGLTYEKLEQELVDIAKQKREKTKKESTEKSPGELVSLQSLGNQLAFYRSYIVECTNSVIFEYCPIVKELGEKHGLTWSDVLLLDYQEVIDLNDKNILPRSFEKRRNGYGKIIMEGKKVIITGGSLEKELSRFREKVDQDIKEINGMVASRGGIIRGIVRVVEESALIAKMEDGDILVANETTPDYVVGMKIAGAIITNQGGITSHAAITSREMGIPCIIGTKIATKVLKDGDMVEVDAEKGVVKLIN